MESMGGLVVDQYFEIRACAAGLLDVVVKTIDSKGAATAMEQVLSAENMKTDAVGIHWFLTKSASGVAIRDEVKGAIADAVEDAGCKMYADSIRQSVLPISGGQ